MDIRSNKTRPPTGHDGCSNIKSRMKESFCMYVKALLAKRVQLPQDLLGEHRYGCHDMLQNALSQTQTEINSHLLKLCYLKVQGCAQIKGYSGEWEEREKGKEERNKPSKLKTGYQINLLFTFICFQNGKVVFPQVLKTSSDINEIQTPFLIKGTKSWYFSLCFFFFFFF